MDVTLLLIIAAICLGMAWLLGQFLSKKEKSTFSKLPNFKPTLQQTFLTKKSGITGIAIDENSGQLAVSDGRRGVNVYGFAQVENIEVEINQKAVQVSSLSSQAIRGAAGAVLLGPAGLIIGAITGRKETSQKVSQLALKIEVNDVEKPIHRVVFYDDKGVDIEHLSNYQWARDAEVWVKRVQSLSATKP